MWGLNTIIKQTYVLLSHQKLKKSQRDRRREKRERQTNCKDLLVISPWVLVVGEGRVVK